ncbi:hypothetical protein RP20_CCG021065 [Aedes albopictus]|nr:hypothetical protein RP20_CCG021065 [Aedes albopictus]
MGDDDARMTAMGSENWFSVYDVSSSPVCPGQEDLVRFVLFYTASLLLFGTVGHTNVHQTTD